ncbi:MAG: hypothetical protein LBF69_05130 [Prevotellaceae bacterium]|nr:hypothetical protein [Prevotellaceae bacterium]
MAPQAVGLHRLVEPIPHTRNRIPSGCDLSAAGCIPTECRCCGGYGVSTKRHIPMGCESLFNRNSSIVNQNSVMLSGFFATFAG